MAPCDSLWTLLLSMALQAALLYYFTPHEFLPYPSPSDYYPTPPFCIATHYQRDDPVSGFTEVFELPPNLEDRFGLLQDLLGRHGPPLSPYTCLPTHFQGDDPVSGFTEVLELPPNWENSKF
uniref:Uncharacterized protein n=1 Tax=viral metagenome TaxID=1070528 RepID=A0A6C0KAR9_9ZZZZ